MSPRGPARGRRLARAAYVGRVNGDLRDVSRLLEAAERGDPGAGESLEAAVARSYLLLVDQMKEKHDLDVGEGVEP